MSLSTIRHDEVFPTHKHNDPVHLIGAGAIGSRVWSALVELGLTNLHVYDFDKIEPHNLANQLFFNEDIGEFKIDGLRKWTKLKLGYVPQSMQFNNIKLEICTPEDPCPQPKLEHTVILAVDSIAARKEIVDYIALHDMPVIHVFDTRMASTHGNVVHFNPQNPIATEKYMRNLPSDEHAEVSACGTSLTVGTTASIIANLAVWQLMHSRNEPAAMDNFIEIYLKPLCLSLEGPR